MSIQAIVTDLDGVLTDGGMYYDCTEAWNEFDGRTIESGFAMKRFHTRDASAARWLKENTDVKLFVITAGDSRRNSTINSERMKIMYLTEPIHQGVEDKLEKVTDICKRHDLDIAEVAYIGDDQIDRHALSSVGFPACPSDALQSVRDMCRCRSVQNGGCGVLGDLIDHWVLRDMIEEKGDVC